MLWAVLFCAARLQAAVSLQRDDQVLFVRDEPMLFHDEPRATARKGQVFTVLAATPENRRVYLLTKDPDGKPASYNVGEGAVVLLPGRGDGAFLRALSWVRMLRWPEAMRELDAAILAEPTETLYPDFREHLDRYIRSELALPQALAAQESVRAQSRIKRQNADRAEQLTPLDPSDRSAQTRAAASREAADRLDKDAQAAVDAAKQAKEKALDEIDDYIAQSIDAGRYDAALALANVWPKIAPARNGEFKYVKTDLDKIGDAAALADGRSDAAERDALAGRLSAADREIGEGLAAMGSHRRLKALQMQVQMRLATVSDRLPEIDAAEAKGDYPGALRLVETLLTGCVDHPELLKRRMLLRYALANSGGS